MSEGNKHDGGKAMFHLFPPEALEEIAKVLNFGANKYGQRNWERGITYSQLFSATMRHLWAWWRGEAKDQESKISHLAHASCNIFFLLHFETHGVSMDMMLDDRPFRFYEKGGIVDQTFYEAINMDKKVVDKMKSN